MLFDFHEKRRFKARLYSRLVIVTLFIIAVLLGNSVWGVYKKERETVTKRQEQAEKLERLKEREATLEASLARLSTERGIEEEIRNRFDVAKEGEELLVIVDASEVGSTEKAPPPKSLWQRFLDLF